jgi:hypothetical protein
MKTFCHERNKGEREREIEAVVCFEVLTQHLLGGSGKKN